MLKYILRKVSYTINLKPSQFARQAQNHSFELELILTAKTILPKTNQTYQNQLYFKSKTIQSDK
jgi:hypothetical protein